MMNLHRRGLLAAALPASFNFAAPAAAATAMADRNAEVVRRYFQEVWNEGRIVLLDALLSPDYINHTPSVANPAPGPEGLKPIVLAIRTAFPDVRYKVQDVFATQDRAVARVIMTGTHKGDLFGLPPTGRGVRVNQINIEEIGPDGLIREHWRVTDELALMRQLGRIS
jgi:steroid delta-isomerase-like uncharacterized protein